MIVNVIAAIDGIGGIGKNGTLPWSHHVKEDMTHFTKLTKGAHLAPINAVIMGRKTWESLPAPHRPLTGRLNIVVSSTMAAGYGYRVVRSYDEGVAFATASGMGVLWVIGGNGMYTAALSSSVARVYLTEFSHVDDMCDTFFPMMSLLSGYVKDSVGEQYENGEYKFSFVEYVPK
jgi:dihydrofolate reductase